MLETIADLVAELNVPSKLQEDADLYALDNLRLLHGKLVSLKRVAKLTEPEEWDAMIQALLASKHYGVDDLEARLRPGKQPLTAEACEADGSGAPLLDDAEDAGLPERVGRRLRETITELVDAGAQLGVVQRVGAWAWAILDRPTPWERDCDCCFRECPEEHVCLLQSDGLLLAAAASPSARSSRSSGRSGRWRASPARSPPSSCFSGAACPPRGACGPSPPTTATTATTMTTTTTTAAAATTVRLASTTTMVTAASGAVGLTRSCCPRDESVRGNFARVVSAHQPRARSAHGGRWRRDSETESRW